jgi:uncharacterized UBP type Zn finger protein
MMMMIMMMIASYSYTIYQSVSLSHFISTPLINSSPLIITTIHQVHPTVQKLMDMGFAQSQAQQALLDSKGDENLAIEMLLSA